MIDFYKYAKKIRLNPLLDEINVKHDIHKKFALVLLAKIMLVI